jgi:tRNA(Ile2) C34 agmatinyltransferase TiaS
MSQHCPCGGELEMTREGLGFAYRCAKCGTFSNERTRGRTRKELEYNLDLLDEARKEKRRRK